MIDRIIVILSENKPEQDIEFKLGNYLFIPTYGLDFPYYPDSNFLVEENQGNYKIFGLYDPRMGESEVIYGNGKPKREVFFLRPVDNEYINHANNFVNVYLHKDPKQMYRWLQDENELIARVVTLARQDGKNLENRFVQG